MKRILFSSFLISYPNGQDFPCLSEEKVHFASIDPILTTLVFDCLVKMDEYWSLVLLVSCVFIYRVARNFCGLILIFAIFALFIQRSAKISSRK